jgi:hypothetical protein
LRTHLETGALPARLEEEEEEEEEDEEEEKEEEEAHVRDILVYVRLG